MDFIINARVLAYTALECRSDAFAYELNGHPALATIIRKLKRFRQRACTHVGYNPEQILVSLRYTNKASDLSDPVVVPPIITRPEATDFTC